MNLAELIKHPERLNKETLYDLRSLIAMYPYYQPARLLMLQNLYLLHDSSFDEELRRAAVYITDRRVIFNMVEAAHYKLKRPTTSVPKGDRTTSLIDTFLSNIPADEEEEKKQESAKVRRKPTAADATVDYVSYLMSVEFADEEIEQEEMKGQSLIDDFLNKEDGKIVLKDEIEFVPQVDQNSEKSEKDSNEEYFTETLAGVYIKQGKYLKALEIIKRLNLEYPKKNVYFADQIRFLEKLIAISNSKKS